jgi:serine/threonine protein phosphatase PrpC
MIQSYLCNPEVPALIDVGNISIGMFEQQGDRSSQQDRLYALIANDFANLPSFLQKKLLYDAFVMAASQSSHPIFLSSGSTGCGALAYREEQSVHIITANLGDSTAILVKVDKEGYLSGFERLNQLHNPTLGSNEFKRIVESYPSKTPEWNGSIWRLKDGLALSRGFGDTESQSDGLIYEPEVTKKSIVLKRGERAFLLVACDGLEERPQRDKRRAISAILSTLREQSVLDESQALAWEASIIRALPSPVTDREKSIAGAIARLKVRPRTLEESARLVKAFANLEDDAELNLQEMADFLVELIAEELTPAQIAHKLNMFAFRQGSGDNISVGFMEIVSSVASGVFVFDGHGMYGERVSAHIGEMVVCNLQKSLENMVALLPDRFIEMYCWDVTNQQKKEFFKKTLMLLSAPSHLIFKLRELVLPPLADEFISSLKSSAHRFSSQDIHTLTLALPIINSSSKWKEVGKKHTYAKLPIESKLTWKAAALTYEAHYMILEESENNFNFSVNGGFKKFKAKLTDYIKFDILSVNTLRDRVILIQQWLSLARALEIKKNEFMLEIIIESLDELFHELPSTRIALAYSYKELFIQLRDRLFLKDQYFSSEKFYLSECSARIKSIPVLKHLERIVEWSKEEVFTCEQWYAKKILIMLVDTALDHFLLKTDIMCSLMHSMSNRFGDHSVEIKSQLEKRKQEPIYTYSTFIRNNFCLSFATLGVAAIVGVACKEKTACFIAPDEKNSSGLSRLKLFASNNKVISLLGLGVPAAIGTLMSPHSSRISYAKHAGVELKMLNSKNKYSLFEAGSFQEVKFSEQKMFELQEVSSMSNKVLPISSAPVATFVRKI